MRFIGHFLLNTRDQKCYRECFGSFNFFISMARLMYLEAALAEERSEERTRQRRSLREWFVLQKNRIPDLEFISSYRLSRELFQQLCDDIVPLMSRRSTCRGMDPISRILAALNFFARGSYQGAVGLNMDAPMSQQAISRCINEVAYVLNAPNILRKYIRFPQNRNERNVLKQKFSTRFGIPGVIGCIDCTHIAIVRPVEQEERFFNRKHFHSLNVQTIVDCDLLILNIDASYGGATHDAFIWEQSEIKDHLEALQGETAVLLGDSGYPLREYLMTPIENAADDSPEGRYNHLHRQVRSVVERTFGVLKGRWRCLLAARELHYCPRTAAKITIACAVLHNLCERGKLQAPALTEEEIRGEHERQVQIIRPMTQALGLNRGRRAREGLVQLLNNNR